MNLLAESLSSLKAHPLRAALAMIGVIWGIGSVVLLVSLVSGFHREILGTLEASAYRVVFVAANQHRGQADIDPGKLLLTPSDAAFILQNVPLAVDAASAENSKSNVTARADSRTASVVVRGVYPESLAIRNLRVREGRFLNPLDLSEASRYAILGADVGQRLFGEDSPVGKTVELGSRRFLIVGTLSPAGTFASRVIDRSVLLPYTTVSKLFTGSPSAASIALRVRVPGQDTECVDKVRQLLHKTRGIPLDQEAFLFVNWAENYRLMNRLLGAAKLLVGAVGSITLLVALIGVANIMLVSVAERTSEIGIRKAVGARKRSILTQFLIEALVLTGLAGVVGMVWGTILAKLVGLLPIPDFPKPYVSGTTLLVSFLILVASGVLAGIIPAIRASRMQPHDALRVE